MRSATMRGQPRLHLLPRGRKEFQIGGLILCCSLLLSWHIMSDYLREMNSRRDITSVVTDQMTEIEGFQETLPHSTQPHRQVRTDSIQFQNVGEQNFTPNYAVFTSPKPFEGDSVSAQKHAVESWLSINVSNDRTWLDFCFRFFFLFRYRI